MTEKVIHILLIEDEEAHGDLVRRSFEPHAVRFSLTVAGTLEQAMNYLTESTPDLVITDLLLPDGKGTDLLQTEEKRYQLPLVVMTKGGDEQGSVEAIKNGAFDYVVKSEATLADMPNFAERTMREWGYTKEGKRPEKKRRKRETELEAQSKDLKETKSALRVLLKQREEDKKEFENNVVSNMKQLVFPHLEALKKTVLNEEQTTLVDLLESNLNKIISPFASKLSSEFISLSPKEIQIADLIKEGKTNKEIAELLCLSKNTVLFHRYNLRAKLGLKNKKINLRSYLQSLHGY